MELRKLDTSLLNGENIKTYVDKVRDSIESGHLGAIETKALFKSFEALAKELDTFLNSKIQNEIVAWGSQKPVVNGFVVETFNQYERIHGGVAYEVLKERLEKAKADLANYEKFAETLQVAHTYPVFNEATGEIEELQALPCKKIPKGSGIKFTRVRKS